MCVCVFAFSVFVLKGVKGVFRVFKGFCSKACLRMLKGFLSFLGAF